MIKPSHPELDPPSAEVEIRALLQRARQGDLEVLPRLRHLLDHSPELWEHYGDLSAHAEAAWIALASGSDLQFQESLARKIAALKAELSGPAPSPLERFLIDRIGATWLQVAYADAVAAQAQDASLKQVEFAMKRRDRAHRRHLTAVAALATVRRLLPAVASPADTSWYIRDESARTPAPADPGAQASSQALPLPDLFDPSGGRSSAEEVPGRPSRSRRTSAS
jgi:hypothetical protein